MENTVDGKFFVTARGWEDLSRLLQSYEKLGIGISEELVEEFLQKEETARDFAGFYQLYTKYGEDYEIPSILSGNLSRENLALKEKMAADGAFEERFAVVNLILGALREKAEEYGQADHQLEVFYEMLLHLRTQVRKNAEEEKLGISLLEEFVQEQENSLQIKVKMELISVREQKYQETAIRRLREYILTAKKEHVRSAENGFKRISKCFEKEAVCREDMIQKLQGELQNAFSFIKESFGENQEMLLFVTGITADKSMTSFIAGNGCPAYFEHSEMLLYNKEENELRKACLEAVHGAKAISTSDWKWDLGFNVAWNNNEITKLTAQDDASSIVLAGTVEGGTGTMIQAQGVNHPANSFYVYEQVYDQQGNPIEGFIRGPQRRWCDQ